MITIEGIARCAKQAQKRFYERIPEAEALLQSVEIIVVPYRAREQIFNETMLRLSAAKKEYSARTEAELIDGKNGKAVLIYQDKFNLGTHGYTTVWHELGHALDSEENKELIKEVRLHIELDGMDPLSVGGSCWEEFIADTISNYVFDPVEIVYSKSDYDRTVRKYIEGILQSNIMKLDMLGHYFGALLTDSRSPDPSDRTVPLLGSERLSKLEQDILRDIADVLLKQINEHMPFWRIERNTLEDLGILISELNDIREIP